MWWAEYFAWQSVQVIQDRWCGLPLNTSSADGDPAADG